LIYNEIRTVSHVKNYKNDKKKHLKLEEENIAKVHTANIYS